MTAFSLNNDMVTFWLNIDVIKIIAIFNNINSNLI